MRTKLTLLLICFTILGIEKASSQNSYIKDRLNLKIGYSRYNEGYSSTLDGPGKRTSHIRFEGNYGFHNLLEGGIYAGLSRFKVFHFVPPDTIHINDSVFIDYSNSVVKDCIVLFYGVGLNFHILPLFVKSEQFRIDTYATVKFGDMFFPTVRASGFKRHQIEYGAGLGLALYTWQRVGFFAEYTAGKYDNNSNTNLRFGLSFKIYKDKE